MPDGRWQALMTCTASWLKSRSGYRHLLWSCAVERSSGSILWQKNHGLLPSKCALYVQCGAAELLTALMQFSRGFTLLPLKCWADRHSTPAMPGQLSDLWAHRALPVKH